MQHVNRMNRGRNLKQILHYQSSGQWSIGSPVKSWEENMRL